MITLRGGKMLNNRILLLMISISTLLIFELICVNNILARSITLEVYSDNEVKSICLKPEDIDKVGIDERKGRATVEIYTVSKFVPILKDITKKNIGKDFVIKVQNEIIFSGVVAEQIIDGVLSLRTRSENEAKSIIKKIGREPDYHLKINPEEIEATKTDREGAKNPWYQKALDAMNHGDYTKAAQFQKIAIEKEPYDPLHYAALSTIFYIQGNLDLALKEMLKAEKLVCNEDVQRYPGIYISLGEYYVQLNENEAAINSYIKILSADENNFNARLGLAKVYEKIDKNDLALQQYLILSKSKDEFFKAEGIEGVNRLKKE